MVSSRLLPVNGIEQFRDQIDLPVIRQTIAHLRQDLDSQKVSIGQMRRRLPRGWYRQSNPTVDLEVVANELSGTKSVKPVCLPRIWPSALTHNSIRNQNR
jgi:hypothetical protein